MTVLENPRNVNCGQEVAFEYNGKTRTGKVERVGKTFITIKHDNPRLFKGKVYSTYQFKRFDSRINVR